MLVLQSLAIALQQSLSQAVPAAVAVALVVGQSLLMRRFLREPFAKAIRRNGFRVPLYSSGMMASALAVRGMR